MGLLVILLCLLPFLLLLLPPLLLLSMLYQYSRYNVVYYCFSIAPKISCLLLAINRCHYTINTITTIVAVTKQIPLLLAITAIVLTSIMKIVNCSCYARSFSVLIVCSRAQDKIHLAAQVLLDRF